MSYNIDSTTAIATVRPLVFAPWPEDRRDDLPESSPLDEPPFDWSGLSSGRTYADGVLRDFAACCTGDATYLLTWEGGDSHSIIRIVDGEVFEHEVEFTPGPVKAKL